MEDREPTIRSRELGEGLRRAMERAGLHASEMARQLDWSASRVSRLLSGKRGGSGYDVMAFLAVCGVKGAEKKRLMALAHDQHRQGWVQHHGSHLPKQLRTLINHEDNARVISEFEFNLVPGLLQTGEYARALMSEAGIVPAEEIDDRVGARLGRRKLFARPSPPKCTFYIHEFAFRLPVGGSAVMSAQLHELLSWSVRPSITVRVVPTARGAHPAINGSFRLMEFKEIKPVVYLESQTSSLFLEVPIEIDTYRTILDALDGVALSEGQSREFIGDLAVELYSDREAHDQLAQEQL